MNMVFSKFENPAPLTRFQIVEAKPYHCGRMLRSLRTMHKDAIASLGLDSHLELTLKFEVSSFKRAWLIDGKLAALGGITGSLAASEGFVWLLVAEFATGYPLAMVKEARQQLAEAMGTKRTLVTTILPEDPVSMKFAVFLGFRALNNGPIEGRIVMVFK